MSRQRSVGRGLVAWGLNQDLKNLAFAVDSAPDIHLPSSD